jgi:hypothetical protein
MKTKSTVPYSFVLELLGRVSPTTRPMFGCTSVYVDDKIVFILRDKTDIPKDNGVWLATTKDHHDSLKKDFPNMRSITVFGSGVSGWQILPVDSDDFETSVTTACEFVLAGDSRIGRLPKPKKKAAFSKKT